MWPSELATASGQLVISLWPATIPLNLPMAYFFLGLLETVPSALSALRSLMWSVYRW